MKSTRSLVFAALAIAVLCGVARLIVPRRQAAQEAAPKSATVDPEAKAVRPRSVERSGEPRITAPGTRQQLSPQEDPAPSISKAPTESARPESQANVRDRRAAQAGPSGQKAAQAKQSTPPAQDVLQDPMARVALAFVGADLDAEMYWYWAINNPSLSGHERQDLIEDLNEDGLSDPQNPTAEDLPLILNRIGLIEAVGWDAMDEVNSDAFQEAYKDLVNLAIQAMGNG